MVLHLSPLAAPKPAAMHAWLAGLQIDDTQDGDGPLDVSHLYMAKPSADEYGRDVIDALIDANSDGEPPQWLQFVRRERVAIVAAFADLTEQAQADGECSIAQYGHGWTVRLEHHDIRDNRGRATRGQAGAN